MKRIAVFGKPAGGKSTLSERISREFSLPFYPLDLIQYSQHGEPIDVAEFRRKHQELIERDEWVIDGFGNPTLLWNILNAADTLVYVDLPYAVHYWWVIKRFFKGLVFTPRGWPEGSSIIRGTWLGFKYLRLSPKFWNSAFVNELNSRFPSKRIYWLKDVSSLENVIQELGCGHT